jgi:nucleoside-diphosphate-sugar epimerase
VAADGIGYDAERAVLDEATRGMHVLLDAVTQAGIRRFIYCSTLELFSTVPHDRYISEHWQPDPGTDMLTLSRHLAEQVTREFARERAITITILRLGRLRREEDVLADEDPDLMWLDRRDAAVAVERAVDRDQSQQLNWQSRWTVYHICARPPHPKFLLDGAGALGFEPVYNFAAAWEGGSA